MADFGRRGATGTFANTIAPKGAEQAMLIKQDEIIDQVNAALAAIAGAADFAAAQAAISALVAISKVKLVP